MDRQLRWGRIIGIVTAVVALCVGGVVLAYRLGPRLRGAIPPGSTRAVEQLKEGVSRGIRTVQPWNQLSLGWVSAEGDETVSGAQRALEVSNVSGPIRITAWDQDAVHVHYVKQARTEMDLKEFVIEVRGDADTVTVRPIYEANGLLGRFGAVELVIQVPRRIARIAAHNVSGDVAVDDLGWPAAQELGTVSGAITTSAAGDLVLESTSGALSFQFTGSALKATTVSGAIKGSIASIGAGKAELSSVSGSIDLEAPAALEAALDLRTVSGSVRSDFPVTIREQSRGKLIGSIGAGSAALSAHSTSGSIAIRKR